MKETICGHAPFFSKGLCQKCYFAQPAVKAKRKEYYAQPAVKAKRKEYYAQPAVKAKRKEYHAQPAVKAKQKEYHAQPAVKAKKKEYYAQPAVKAKRKEYYAKKRARLISQGKIQPRDSIQPFVNTFFKEFSKNKKWRQEGIQKMANLYATTTCDLTKTQQCTLEEKILLKAKKEDE